MQSSPRRFGDSMRAVAPLVGVLALLIVTVALAAVVAVGIGAIGSTDPSPIASFELAVDAADESVVIRHTAGDAIDVEALSVTVTVDGEPLAQQPPVPFFAADGFVSGPEGPLNEATDPEWSPGETASFQVATTNSPSIDPGDEVVVTLETGSGTVARLIETAE